MKLTELIHHPSFVPLFIQLILAYEWLQGGVSKLRGGVFITGMEKTLARFERGNPHDWYITSMLQGAKHRPDLFGQLVQWGEALTGIGLAIAIAIYLLKKSSEGKTYSAYLSILSLLGGLFMNANFYFAAGWTSPSTSGLNALMFWIQITLFVFWIRILSKKNIPSA